MCPRAARSFETRSPPERDERSEAKAAAMEEEGGAVVGSARDGERPWVAPRRVVRGARQHARPGRGSSNGVLSLPVMKTSKDGPPTREHTVIATPRRGGGPGVLVLHPWWGLSAGTRSVCDRLADEGFVALAPDLFHGRHAATEMEARMLRRARRPEPMWRTIVRGVDELRAHPSTSSRRVGVVGLSMGGHWALWLAAQPQAPLAAVAAFYAARASDFARGPRAAFQLHFAEDDAFVSQAAAARVERAIRAAGRRCDAWTYPGTRHWFFEDDRPEHDAGAARLAWGRLLPFLRAEVR